MTGVSIRLLLISFTALLLQSATVPAAARVVVDDAGRHVEVPDRPLRVVSLDDMNLTVPLLELGVVPVASQGRLDRSGRTFLRSSRSLTGMDFEDTDMMFLGINPIDVETIAAAKPDLIVMLKARTTPVEQLQRIAPTIVIDDVVRDAASVYMLLARSVGREAEAERLERRYRAAIDELRRIMPAGGLSASVITATADGKIALEHTYGALGSVLRDAGFRLPAMADALAGRPGVNVSPEALPKLDADVMFDTYRNDRGERPQHARRRLEAIAPEACSTLRACSAGRLYLVPRDEAKSTSYAAKFMAAAQIIAIVPLLVHD